MSVKKEKNVKSSENLDRIPIKWHTPETIVTRVATNMVFQRLEGGFCKLSFFEVKPEVRISGENEQEELPSEMLAECVCSVVVSPEKLPAFVDVLQRQAKLTQENKGEKSE